jgi:hypothetical protein
MRKLNFRDLTPETKKEMNGVIERWKRTGTSVRVLAESLEMLASRRRPAARDLMQEPSDEVAGIAVTWGKANGSKLALNKEHAGLLLSVVLKIEHAAKQDETLAAQMVEHAGSVLLLDGKVPSTITDPSWGKVLGILSGIDSRFGQNSLF